MAMIKCPECGKDVSDKANSCVHCGNQLKEENKRFCTDCGTQIKSGEKVCSNCGCPVENKNSDVKNSVNSDPNKLRCPHCNSDNVNVQIVSHQKGAGCLTIFFYIFLALTIVGIPIMLIILLLKGKKTVNNKYYVCQNCGRTFNPALNFKGPNGKTNAAAVVIAVVVIVFACIAIAVSIASEDTDFIEFDQYQQLDVQALHNDYLDNEISADEKYKGNYYTFTGQIYDITEFWGDKYMEIRYTSQRNKNNVIELNAYFSSSDAFANVKKGDTVTVYCKYKQRGVEDYMGIYDYSFHSCKMKDSTIE